VSSHHLFPPTFRTADSSESFRRIVSHQFSLEAEVDRIKLAARRFVKEEEGAALAEYGILVAFIAIVAITAVTFFGSRISAKFSALGNAFT
jgi:pilus assembly protein Flp/PilA